MSTEMKDWLADNESGLIHISSSTDGHEIYYDPSRGMYRVRIYFLGILEYETWFDAYGDKEFEQKIDGNTSDGYHTFNELYDHRAKLFSVIVRNYPDKCWKSKLHHDGSMFDGMFIVGINTPDGQATYHYDINPYWNMFDCKELDKAPEWDGHTPQRAIERISALLPVNTDSHASWVRKTGMAPPEFHNLHHCSTCGMYALKNKHFREELTDYCPHCGARMDGVKSGTCKES